MLSRVLRKTLNLVTSIVLMGNMLVACGGGGGNASTPSAPPNPPSTYSVTGSVSGLGNNSLTLSLGAQSQTVSGGATAFTFTGLTSGTYTLSVTTQPSGLTCTVNTPIIAITNSNLNNAAISCSSTTPPPPPPSTYSVTGSVSGLGNNSLTLTLGSQSQTVSGGATTFTFSGLVSGTYTLSVTTQPTGLTCTVNTPTITIINSNLNNAAISCSSTTPPPPPPSTYSVTGSVSGLGNNSLTLSLGAQTQTVSGGATAFTFTGLVSGTYTLSVTTQPSGLTCTVNTPTITIINSNLNNAAISCSSNTPPPPSTYSVTGSVSGLGNNSLTLSLGAQTQTVSGGATAFTFTGLASGTYNLSVTTQPSGLTCTVNNPTIVITNSNITNVTVTCSTTVQSGGVDTGTNINFGGTNGWLPSGVLVADAAGNVYGTTMMGGTYGYGTVYKVTPDDMMTVLYSFGATLTDGLIPLDGLTIDASGNLFGTTRFGGQNGRGTIFKIATNGTKSEVFSFPATSLSYPSGGVLFDSAGNIYGTTFYNDGSIYQLTPSLTLNTLHAFNTRDGFQSMGQLTMDKQGIIYGATRIGGSASLGVLYSISSTGSYHLLHSFSDGSVSNDGAGPQNGVIFDGVDTIYGTTCCSGDNGAGTIFKWSISGQTYAKVYSFDYNTDGAFPFSLLTLDSAQNLWGTVYNGGRASTGAIFKISAGGQLLFERVFTSSSYRSLTNVVLYNNRVITTTAAGGVHGYGGFVDIHL